MVIQASVFSTRIVSALLLLCSFGARTAVAAPKVAPNPADHPAADTARGQSAYGNLPLSFEPNRGQTDASVSYVTRGSGYAVYLSPSAVTLAMHSAAPANPRPDRTVESGAEAAVRMSLLGAQASATMIAEHPLPGVASYIHGRNAADWQLGLPTFASTRATGVYPGIDVVYYGTRGKLEYDFVLAPGADAGQVRMAFDGAVPTVDANGDLTLHVGDAKDGGEMKLHRPLLYQGDGGGKQSVAGRFVIAENREVRFEVGQYDHSRTLTIDPYIEYSSFLGGSTQDTIITGMTVDATGAMYVTGTTHALDYPTTTGVFEPSCPQALPGPQGQVQYKCGVSSPGVAFAAKIAPGGQSLIYSTYLGGKGLVANQTGADFGGYIAVDPSGNARLAGQTVSDDFPISSDGIEQYCSPAAASFDFNINQYVGIANTCYRNTNVGYQYGAPDVFVVKLNATGTSVLYGTFLGGVAYEEPVGIALDATGNVFIAGNTQSSSSHGGALLPTGYYMWDVTDGVYLFPTTGNAYERFGNPAANVSVPFVSELSPDGHQLLYSSTFWESGSYVCANADCGDVQATAMAIGNSRVSIVGQTAITILPVTSGALKAACTQGQNPHSYNAELGFVATFDTTRAGLGSLLYSSNLGGTAPAPNFFSKATAVAMTPTGDVVVEGATQQSDFPATTGVIQPTCARRSANQCGAGFVTKITAAGNLAWSTYFGSPTGTGGQYGVAALALDPAGNVYITNNADGVPDIPTTISFMPQATGNAYVAVLKSDGTTELFGTYFGNGGNMFPRALFADSASNLYMAGSVVDSLPLVHAFQSTNAGGFNEGFFTKIVTAPVNSATTLVAAPTTGPAGTPVTLTATVTGVVNAPAPTGTVTFKNGTATIGTGTVNGTGVATFAWTLPSGSSSVTAVFGGDTNYNASTSSAVAVTSTKSASTTTLVAAPASVAVGANVVLTATVTTAATGTVTFFNGATSLGTATVASSTATLTTTFATAASFSITAVYSGDTAYNGSTSAAAAVTVTKSASTTTLSASANSVGTGASVVLTATVTSGATGAVTFFCGTTSLGTATVSGNGTAALTTSFATGHLQPYRGVRWGCKVQCQHVVAVVGDCARSELHHHGEPFHADRSTRPEHHSHADGHLSGRIHRHGDSIVRRVAGHVHELQLLTRQRLSTTQWRGDDHVDHHHQPAEDWFRSARPKPEAVL